MHAVSRAISIRNLKFAIKGSEEGRKGGPGEGSSWTMVLRFFIFRLSRLLYSYQNRYLVNQRLSSMTSLRPSVLLPASILEGENMEATLDGVL